MLFLPSRAIDDPTFTPGTGAGAHRRASIPSHIPKNPTVLRQGHYVPTHWHYHPVWRHQLSGSVRCQDKASWFQIVSAQIPTWHKITSDLNGPVRWCSFETMRSAGLLTIWMTFTLPSSAGKHILSFSASGSGRRGLRSSTGSSCEGFW